jgi:hypothetical protein
MSDTAPRWEFVDRVVPQPEFDQALRMPPQLDFR